MNRKSFARPGDDAGEQHGEDHGAQGERSARDGVVGSLGFDERGDCEDERLRGDDSHDHRPAPDDDDADSGGDEQPATRGRLEQALS